MSLDLESEPRAIEHARSFLLGVTTRDLAPGLRADAALVMSELVTNAVVHGHGPVSATVEIAREEVLLQVQDSSQDGPLAREDTDQLLEGGRGLAIVTGLCHRWGWRRLGHGGKSVWALLCSAPPPALALPGPARAQPEHGTGCPAHVARGARDPVVRGQEEVDDGRGRDSRAGPAERAGADSG